MLVFFHGGLGQALAKWEVSPQLKHRRGGWYCSLAWAKEVFPKGFFGGRLGRTSSGGISIHASTICSNVGFLKGRESIF